MLNKLLILLVGFNLLGCAKNKDASITYQNQIGDTPFDANLDDINFTFCDSTNVLHRRALIQYTGGTQALENELLERFNTKPEYEHFNGYFVIRFAVNCKDITGRFRIEVLDSNFNLTTSPKGLRQHIKSIFKALKYWNHAVYEGKDYDGYRFHCIKMVNGKIQKS